MPFTPDKIYTELKRLYDMYNPFYKPFVNIGRPCLDDDQVTIYTSYHWKGPDGRWYITNYYMGKYMDVIYNVKDHEHYSKIVFDPYVPSYIQNALNELWSTEIGCYIDMLGNKLLIEYHYKNRDEYLASFNVPEIKDTTSKKT